MEKASVPALSADGICRILKACSQYGVVNLEMADFRVVFGQLPSKEMVFEYASQDHREPLSSEMEKERVDEIEAKIKRDQLDELKLTDPYEYEQLLQAQELEVEQE